MMRLRYRGNAHQIGEAGFTITREPQTDASGRIYAYREIWTISGQIYNRSGRKSDMDAHIRRIEEMYSVNGGDLELVTIGGSANEHRLRSSDTVGGIRVVRPVSYPVAGGPQYVTIRNFQVALEAIVPTVAGRFAQYLEFSESVSFNGGGPLFGHIETANTDPVPQQFRQATLYRAVQRGTATGLYAEPPIPGPLFPGARPRPLETPFTFDSPGRLNGFPFGYRVSWEYEFESARPLVGRPHNPQW